MSIRTETPQETLQRLQSHENAVVTPVSGDTVDTPHERRRLSRGSGRSRSGERVRGRPRSVLRLVVTALLGIAALLFGGVGAVAAAEMAIFGEAVTAEVVSVEPLDDGANRILVEYPVDGVDQRSTMDEKGNAPQPGQSMDVVYDTRDVTQVAEAPTAVFYGVIAVFVGIGLYWIISAFRGFRQRRASQWLT